MTNYSACSSEERFAVGRKDHQTARPLHFQVKLLRGRRVEFTDASNPNTGTDHPSTSVGMAQHMGGLGPRDPGLPRSTELDLSLPRVLPVIPDVRSGSNSLRSPGLSLGPLSESP